LELNNNQFSEKVETVPLIMKHILVLPDHKTWPISGKLDYMEENKLHFECAHMPTANCNTIHSSTVLSFEMGQPSPKNCRVTKYRVITKEMTEIKHVLLSHGVT
jgi:hypothetical protein